jgi:hypothetical protein
VGNKCRSRNGRECAEAQGDIATYYEDGQWKNKREGTDRAFGADQIGSKNSYGNDPRNVSG